jgi:hypothetical protein
MLYNLTNLNLNLQKKYWESCHSILNRLPTIC